MRTAEILLTYTMTSSYTPLSLFSCEFTPFPRFWKSPRWVTFSGQKTDDWHNMRRHESQNLKTEDWWLTSDEKARKSKHPPFRKQYEGGFSYSPSTCFQTRKQKCLLHLEAHTKLSDNMHKHVSLRLSQLVSFDWISGCLVTAYGVYFLSTKLLKSS